MKRPLTEKQKQWLWFAVLWGGGLLSVITLSTILKFFMSFIE